MSERGEKAMDNQPEKTDIKDVGCSREYDVVKTCGVQGWLCPSCRATQFSQEPEPEIAERRIEKMCDYLFTIGEVSELLHQPVGRIERIANVPGHRIYAAYKICQIALFDKKGIFEIKKAIEIHDEKGITNKGVEKSS